MKHCTCGINGKKDTRYMSGKMAQGKTWHMRENETSEMRMGICHKWNERMQMSQVG